MSHVHTSTPLCPSPPLSSLYHSYACVCVHTHNTCCSACWKRSVASVRALILAASWYIRGRNFLLCSWDAPSCVRVQSSNTLSEWQAQFPYQRMEWEWVPNLDNGIDTDVGAVGKPEGTQPEYTEIMFILRQKQKEADYKPTISTRLRATIPPFSLYTIPSSLQFPLLLTIYNPPPSHYNSPSFSLHTPVLRQRM